MACKPHFINMKSASIATNTLTANTIYRLCRETETFVAADYANDGDTQCSGTKGIRFINRTNGKMYIWYGAVPTAMQTPATFADAAIIIEAGGYFEPPYAQIGLCYMMFASPAAGYVHHLSH